MLKFFVRCHVHAVPIAVLMNVRGWPCRAAQCWEAVRHRSLALHCYGMGGSISANAWCFHHLLLLLPEPAFAFWSGANESRYIASLAECKISKEEEIGKIPRPAHRIPLSLPLQAAQRSAGVHHVHRGMPPLRHSSVLGHLDSFLSAIFHFKGTITFLLFFLSLIEFQSLMLWIRSDPLDLVSAPPLLLVRKQETLISM